jgi:hypothetical protein
MGLFSKKPGAGFIGAFYLEFLTGSKETVFGPGSIIQGASLEFPHTLD